MESLLIKYTDDPEVPEKTREEVRPGAPYIIFSSKPYVAVSLDNPILGSGLFTININVKNNETTKQFKHRVAKVVGMKGECFFILNFYRPLILFLS